jgi:hypothetical protein
VGNAVEYFLDDEVAFYFNIHLSQSFFLKRKFMLDRVKVMRKLINGIGTLLYLLRSAAAF